MKEQGLDTTHAFLKSKTQVGSARFEKVDYLLETKVFHIDDVPQEVKEKRVEANLSKKPNILGKCQQSWNQSSIADQKVQKDQLDVRKRLIDVRCGLADEKTMLPGRNHSDKEIEERQKFIVAITGKGPVGKCSGKWFNAVDERGLASHCIRDDWPDWNCSSSAHAKEDIKQALFRFDERELRRVRAHTKASKLNAEAYVSPTKSQGMLNDRIRDIKCDFMELKDEFKRSLKEESPKASEERLQAMAQRLVGEKLLADEKARRFPAQNETFKPNQALTTQDRRYKVFHHAGSWSYSQAEQRYCWSCCMSFTENSRGCDHKVVNPDNWCTLGYERSPGFVKTGAASRA